MGRLAGNHRHSFWSYQMNPMEEDHDLYVDFTFGIFLDRWIDCEYRRTDCAHFVSAGIDCLVV